MTKIEREGFEGVVLELKAAGFSFDAISQKLKDKHGVNISSASVFRYMQKRDNKKTKQSKPNASQLIKEPLKPSIELRLPPNSNPKQILADTFLKAVKLLYVKTEYAIIATSPVPRKEADFTDKLITIMGKYEQFLSIEQEREKTYFDSVSSMSTEEIEKELSALKAELGNLEKDELINKAAQNKFEAIEAKNKKTMTFKIIQGENKK